MFAYILGSYFVHRPPSPRYVGIPLSVDNPAPVNAIISLELLNIVFNFPIFLSRIIASQMDYYAFQNQF